MTDLSHYRSDFPMLQTQMQGKPLIYLDTAATAQKPQVVIDAESRFYARENATVHRGVYEISLKATRHYQQTRSKVRALLNAEKEKEIIFTKGTTEGINLVASSFGKAFVEPGDEVLITESEHHANIVPWQFLCQERGAVLRIVPINERGEIELEQFSALLSEKTKIVALSHISNVLGTIHPVKQVIDRAHQVGAAVLVDGAQSVPHMPVDVQELGADFYLFSGHKFYGPTGVGVLYGKEKWLEAMPPYQGGGDMIETVTFAETTFNDLPTKFEAGTPMIAQVIGLGAAIDYISAVDLSAIAVWEQKLLSYATEALQKIPQVRLIGTARDKGAILSFTVAGAHSLDVGTLLDLKGIAVRTGHHCAQPTMEKFGVTSTVRASFAFYNTFEEIDQFTCALKEVLTQLL